jgi:hypothetical protein
MRLMSTTTVTGRVRGTVRLKDGGHAGAGARVVQTSWASDRAFPRTTGAAVAFELEAGDGAVYRVDPFEALVALPVRETAVRDGVRHEAAWIAVADEITVEGELERAGRGRAPPALRARRIAMTTTDPAAPSGAGLHRLPPRALQRGESERIDAAPAPVPAVTTVVNVPVGEPPAPDAPAAEPPASSAAAASPAAEPAARRPKKKRPDSSGTPTPVE